MVQVVLTVLCTSGLKKSNFSEWRVCERKREVKKSF